MKEALQRLSGLPLLVVGDVMIDRYHWGETERISPEAPVPVVRVRREELRLGGAGNVAHNLAELGCEVRLCALVGADEGAETLRGRLQGLGVDPAGLVAQPGRPTTTKARVMSQNQQLLRLDWEDNGPVTAEAQAALSDYIRRVVPQCAGVLVSDYAKGVVTPETLAAVREACAAAGTPFVVDPKGRDYAPYAGAACLTPNEGEAAGASGMPCRSEAEVLAAARALAERHGLAQLCITRGPEGVLGLASDGTHRFLPARAREVYDVTGAGDTFISVLGALLAAGVPFYECIEAANLAAGIVVGKVGTATVSVAEMLDAGAGGRKLYAPDEIGPLAERLRTEGRRVVFTNGCFDLIHAGHIQYLQASRAEGDALIVGLNDDASVRRLKGPARPVIGEEDRAHLLAALACVDYVVLFGEDTPLHLIRAIRPDVLTKGEDYTVETVVGHEVVQAYGGQVRLIPLAENRSTSGLIERIVEGHRRES